MDTSLKKESSVTIAIGAYKEAVNLSVLLPSLQEVLAPLNLNYEILVIDTDPSLDNTMDVCRQFPYCTYVKRDSNNKNSYGDMVRTALKVASKDKILFMDADGSHHPSYIPEFIKQSNFFDVVIGSRYICGGNSKNNKLLVIESLLLNWAYRLFLLRNVKDVSNSFRLYDIKQMRALNLSAQNFDILEEILVKLELNFPALRIKEIPIEFYPRSNGKTKRKFIYFLCSSLGQLVSLTALKLTFNIRRKFNLFS